MQQYLVCINTCIYPISPFSLLIPLPIYTPSCLYPLTLVSSATSFLSSPYPQIYTFLFFPISTPTFHHTCVHRYQCGVPVIIEGETGVGKTALVKMLSKLWNQGMLLEWERKHSQLLELIKRKLKCIPKDVSENYQVC